MKKYLLLSLFLLFIIRILPVKAQEIVPVIKRNAIFVELLGNGGFYSLNYDRILISKDKWKLAGRAGFTYHKFSGNYNTQFYGIPLEVSYLRGKGNHFFETGLGITPLYHTSDVFSESSPKQETLYIVTPVRLGYRYQRKEGGFFFKAGWTPQFHKGYRLDISNSPKTKGDFFYFFGGIAAGYTF